MIFTIQGQQLEYEFKGGAGEASVNKQVFPKMEMQDFKEQSPETESEDEFSDVEKKLKEKMEVTPIRHSERTSGKKFRYYSNHILLLDINCFTDVSSCKHPHAA